jgi:hypothetical protein
VLPDPVTCWTVDLTTVAPVLIADCTPVVTPESSPTLNPHVVTCNEPMEPLEKAALNMFVTESIVCVVVHVIVIVTSKDISVEVFDLSPVTVMTTFDPSNN